MDARKPKQPSESSLISSLFGVVADTVGTVGTGLGLVGETAYNMTVGLVIPANKPEPELIAEFWLKYVSLTDDDLQVIDVFTNAMGQCLAPDRFIYHNRKENKECESAYHYFFRFKGEILGIYQALAKPHFIEEEILAKPLHELVKFVKTVIEKNYTQYKPQSMEAAAVLAKRNPVTATITDDIRRVFLETARSNQKYFEMESKLESRAKRAYETFLDAMEFEAVETMIREFNRALSTLTSTIKTKKFEENLKNYANFLRVKDALANMQISFYEKTSATYQALSTTYKATHGRTIEDVERILSVKINTKQKIQNNQQELTATMAACSQFEIANRRRIEELERHKNAHDDQLEYGRKLLKNLKETLADVRLRGFWSRQCYTFMGCGGEAIRVQQTEVRVPHGIAAIYRALNGIQEETLNLDQIRSLLREFKRIVDIRRRVRSEISFLSIQVRQNPTIHFYEKFTKLNVEELTETTADSFAFGHAIVAQEPKQNQQNDQVELSSQPAI